MRRRGYAWVAAIVLALALPTFAEDQDTGQLCAITNMPVEIATDRSIIKLDSFSVYGTTDYTMGSFDLTNEGKNPIIHAAIVVDLLDATGNRLLSLPLFFRDDSRLDCSRTTR